MPLYTYDCSTCGDVQVDIRLIEDRDNVKRCNCGANMKRRMEAVSGIFVDMPGAPHENRSDEFWLRAEKHKQKQMRKRDGLDCKQNEI